MRIITSMLLALFFVIGALGTAQAAPKDGSKCALPPSEADLMVIDAGE